MWCAREVVMNRLIQMLLRYRYVGSRVWLGLGPNVLIPCSAVRVDPRRDESSVESNNSIGGAK